MSEQILEVHEAGELAAYADAELYRTFDTSWLHLHAPDCHLVLLSDNIPQARCSLWWTDVPQMEGQRAGMIGHYAALDAHASESLLAQACERLRAQQCTLAVGPMNGNTWRSYRFVTDSNGDPAYFLEPVNPPEWPQYWQDSGFTPLATYSSGVTSDLSKQDERLPRVEKRLHELGVTLRPLNVTDFENELRRIFKVSLVSFSKNYLYTPIDENEFITQYSQVKPLVKPELTLIAELAGEPVGYLFAIPDIYEQRRGEPVHTIIIKTVAVLPGSRHAGLGALLVDRVQQQARALGMTRAIHALMHDSNHSRNISGHYATTMRRYTLFAKPL